MQGVRIFFHFFASRQVKISFYFTNNINVFPTVIFHYMILKDEKNLSVTVYSALYLLICSSSAYRKKF